MLNNLCDWFLSNKMSFNKDKTSYMFFDFKRKTSSDDIGLSLDNVRLSCESLTLSNERPMSSEDVFSFEVEKHIGCLIFVKRHFIRQKPITQVI